MQFSQTAPPRLQRRLIHSQYFTEIPNSKLDYFQNPSWEAPHNRTMMQNCARLCSKRPPVKGTIGRKQGVSLQCCSGCAAAFHLIHYCNFPLKSRWGEETERIKSFGQWEFTGRYSLHQTAGDERKKIILWCAKLAPWNLLRCNDRWKSKRWKCDYSKVSACWKKKGVCECDTQCEVCALVP